MKALSKNITSHVHKIEYKNSNKVYIENNWCLHVNLSVTQKLGKFQKVSIAK